MYNTYVEAIDCILSQCAFNYISMFFCRVEIFFSENLTIICRDFFIRIKILQVVNAYHDQYPTLHFYTHAYMNPSRYRIDANITGA